MEQRNVDEELAEELILLLSKHNYTITTAESCTGGLLAAALIHVAGASKVYCSGQITYSNEAKHKFLGVRKKTLQKHGAVSKQTVKQMAKGAAKLNHSNVAISVSGIAGPDGGTAEKPVGLVYIGCCVGGKVKSRKYQFFGNRLEIRKQAVTEALRFAKDSLEQLSLKDEK
ncbi:MAG: CinA family protein [Lachnospiraceae bacterium]